MKGGFYTVYIERAFRWKSNWLRNNAFPILHIGTKTVSNVDHRGMKRDGGEEGEGERESNWIPGSQSEMTWQSCLISAPLSRYSYTVPSNHNLFFSEVLWSRISIYEVASEPDQHLWGCVGAGSAFIKLRRSRISIFEVVSQPDQHLWGCVPAGSAFMRLRWSRIRVYEVALEPDQCLWGCVRAGSAFMRLR